MKLGNSLLQTPPSSWRNNYMTFPQLICATRKPALVELGVHTARAADVYLAEHVSYAG